MTNECAQLVDHYLQSMKEAFTMHETPEGCVIVTPYMRRDNDYIEIGVELQPDGRLLLTDYGETLAYLHASGVNVARSAELRRSLDRIGRRFRVDVSDEEIKAFAEPQALGLSLDRVISAVNDAAYLVYKRLRRPALSFDEKVEKLLAAEGFKYDPGYRVQGRTEVHTIRFYVDSQMNGLVEPLSATSSNAALAKAERLAFRWMDIQQITGQYQKIAVLDDEGVRQGVWPGRPLEVLSGYSDVVIPWSRVDQLAPALRRTRLM